MFTSSIRIILIVSVEILKFVKSWSSRLQYLVVCATNWAHLFDRTVNSNFGRKNVGFFVAFGDFVVASLLGPSHKETQKLSTRYLSNLVTPWFILNNSIALSGPKWYPIVGSQFYLRRKAKKAGGQHFLFDAWRKKYDSPVIGMKLGQELVVVATTYPIIREVYTSDVFNGRPDNFFFRQRSMGTRYFRFSWTWFDPELDLIIVFDL